MGQKKDVVWTTKFSMPLWYQGNLLFLILFLFIWLPVGILLLLKNINIATQTSKLYLVYHGKWRWLFFWGILFFPISIVLLLIKGVDVIEEKKTSKEEGVVGESS